MIFFIELPYSYRISNFHDKYGIINSDLNLYNHLNPPPHKPSQYILILYKNLQSISIDFPSSYSDFYVARLYAELIVSLYHCIIFWHWLHFCSYASYGVLVNSPLELFAAAIFVCGIFSSWKFCRGNIRLAEFIASPMFHARRN